MKASTKMDKMIDKELDVLKSSHLTRQCEKCGKMFPPRKLKCDECSGQMSSAEGGTNTAYGSFDNNLPTFFDIGQKGVRNPVKIRSFDPIM